jgi:PAS domain S-box-containing protein
LTALTRRAINEGGVLILRDHPSALRDDGLPFGDKGRPSASIAVVPVRNGRSVVGILSIQSYTSGAYNHYTLETLQALADHAGGALERIRAQEALAESDTRVRSVWANSTDGMRLTDSEGAILDVNEAFCRLVKLPREKLLGNVFSVAYHGHGPNDGIDVYQQRFASGTITPIITARTRLWDATEIDLEITSSFIEIGRQRKMLFSIFRDVSDRFRNQQRIEAFANLGRGLSAARSAMGAATIITEIADRLLGWEACTLDLYTRRRTTNCTTCWRTIPSTESGRRRTPRTLTWPPRRWLAG